MGVPLSCEREGLLPGGPAHARDQVLPFEIVRDPGLSLYRNGCPVGSRAFCARTLHGRPRWHGSGARGVTVAASVVRQAPQGRPRRRARRSAFRSGRRIGPTRDGVPAAGWGTAPGC